MYEHKGAVNTVGQSLHTDASPCQPGFWSVPLNPLTGTQCDDVIYL